MRCAALHRKLGTHISKVKSLTMDTWTAEQVDVSKSVQQREEAQADCLWDTEYEITREYPHEQDLQSQEHQTSGPQRYRRGRCQHGAVHPAEIPVSFAGGWKTETTKPS